MIACAASEYPTHVRGGGIADPDCHIYPATMLAARNARHHNSSPEAKSPEQKHVRFASDTRFEVGRPFGKYLKHDQLLL
jgi:hypothetical protein